MLDLLFYSLIGGLFSLAGGFLLLWNQDLTKKLTTPLISFGAGAFLTAALIDILPEALETANDHHPVLLAVLIGFLIFFTLERFIMTYLKKESVTHEHSAHTESLPFLIILGDSLHNFMDGIIIALAYTANPVLALPTTLAIAAHEIPQEIGDFSVLMHLKWKRAKIIMVNVLQSLLTLPGVFIGLSLGKIFESQIYWLLGATAGGFLYIAASELIPEIHHQSGHKYFFRVLIPMLLSIVLVYTFVMMEH
jgi:zinc and cadmium transporter